MKVMETVLPGVLLIEPDVFEDERGFFLETYRAERYRAAGIRTSFVQDNASFSQRGALRGLHLQNPERQAKLVFVLQGEVFDVAVDVRRGSPSFGRWLGQRLSADNGRQLYIPEGFAHGFCVTSETALFAYKCSRAYRREAEMTLLWSDPDLAIDWPLQVPTLSPRDAAAPRLAEISEECLPRYES